MKKTKKILCLLLCLLTISTSLISTGITTVSAVSYRNISLNGSWVSDSVSNLNEEDYFRFTLASDGEVTLTVMSYTHIKCYLFNDDMSELSDEYSFQGTSSSPTSKAYTYLLSKGSYYFRVNRYTSSDTGSYKIKGSFISYGCNENEPNDYDSAMTLSSNRIVTGCITQSNNSDDWYKIYVPTKCKVTIKLKNYGDARVRLYNNDLSECYIGWVDTLGSSGTLTSPMTTKYTHLLNKGTHYVKITDGKGKYKLSWSYTIKPDVPEDLYITKISKTKISMKWDEDETQVYQIQKKYKGRWVIAGTTKKQKFTAKNLKPNTTYKFRIRGYNSYKGKKYYSKWCKPKTVKTYRH